jgi:hypothetical protein
VLYAHVWLHYSSKVWRLRDAILLTSIIVRQESNSSIADGVRDWVIYQIKIRNINASLPSHASWDNNFRVAGF